MASFPRSRLLRAMARNAAGDAALVDLKAVDAVLAALGRPLSSRRSAPPPRLRQGDGSMAPRSKRRCSTGSTSKSAMASISAIAPDPRAPRFRAGPARRPASASAPRALISEEALARDRPGPAGFARPLDDARVMDPQGAPPSEAAVAGSRRRARPRFPEAGWEARVALERFARILAQPRAFRRISGACRPDFARRRRRRRRQCRTRDSSSASAATLAILKSLGASGGGIVALALIEFLAVGALGIALG